MAEALRAPGEPLDLVARESMERRFGHDFASVRIHAGGTATGSAGRVDADAYTVGDDVVFAAGRYAPATTTGLRLIEHELGHVIEQRRAGIRALQLQGRIQYIEQVVGAEAAPFLDQFDRSLAAIDARVATVPAAEARDLRDAVAQLRALRAAGKVTCWRISGGLVYASWDNSTGQLRLHVNFGSVAQAEGTIVHEAIHAVHAGRYPRLARMYGEVLAAGGTRDQNLGVLLLKWKAWTEYWAYRRQTEYDNLRQQAEFRQDPHRAAMDRGDVRGSIARVREATGQDFRPWEWNPPAQYQAPAPRPASPPARQPAAESGGPR